jgi:hypothetical protein
MKKKIIEEYNWGVYIWKTPEGKVVKNDNGDFLLINSIKNDSSQIEKLRKAAESCGVDGGQAIFLSGHRPVTDEQYEYQRSRLAAGLIPDELDYYAAKEDLEDRKRNGII